MSPLALAEYLSLEIFSSSYPSLQREVKKWAEQIGDYNHKLFSYWNINLFFGEIRNPRAINDNYCALIGGYRPVITVQCEMC